MFLKLTDISEQNIQSAVLFRRLYRECFSIIFRKSYFSYHLRRAASDRTLQITTNNFDTHTNRFYEQKAIFEIDSHLFELNVQT